MQLQINQNGGRNGSFGIKFCRTPCTSLSDESNSTVFFFWHAHRPRPDFLPKSTRDVPPSATAFHPDTQSTTNHFILTLRKREKALCPPRESPFRNTRMQCPRQTLAWLANNTCVAREQHLHGSRTTLVWLVSNTCTARERHLHGSRATQVWNKRVIRISTRH